MDLIKQVYVCKNVLELTNILRKLNTLFYVNLLRENKETWTELQTFISNVGDRNDIQLARLISSLLISVQEDGYNLQIQKIDFSPNVPAIIDQNINNDALHFYGQLKMYKGTLPCHESDAIFSKFIIVLDYLNSHLCDVRTNLNVLHNLAIFTETEKYISQASVENLTKIWENLIVLNMETPYKSVQIQSTKVLESVLKEAQSNELIDTAQQNIYGRILRNWPWTSSVKFTNLTIFYSVYTSSNSARLYTDFDDAFLEGISFSLKYRHLYTAGKNLIRLLAEVNASKINSLIANILRNNSVFEIRNLIKYWLSDVANVEEIYNLLSLNVGFNTLLSSSNYAYLRENDCEKLIIFRKLFHKYFMESGAVCNDFVLNRINCKDVLMRTEVFEILVQNQITSPESGRRDNLEWICIFLQNNCGTDCAAFRHSIFYNLKKLLQHFINKVSTHLNDIDFFFKFLKDTICCFWCYSPSGSDNYQNIIFALNIYKMVLSISVLEQSSGKTSLQIMNKTKLHNYLNENRIWFYDKVNHFNFLLNLIYSEHSDVREIAIELIVAHFLSGSENLLFRSYDFLEKSGKCLLGCTIKDNFNALYFIEPLLNDHKIFRSMNLEAKVHEFVKQSYQKLMHNLNSYELDPLLACQSGQHVFGYINCISKIISSDRLKLKIPFEQYTNSIKAIVDKFLRFLNISDELNAPGFEIMDASVKGLIKASCVVDYKLDEDYKYVLLSIWHTIEACSSFSYAVTKYIITNNELNENLSILKTCIDINRNILEKCCHKGAIEAAGVLLGKIVELITKYYADTELSQCPEDSICHNLIMYLQDLTIDSLQPKKLDYTSEMRSQRGLTIMFHTLIKNDRTMGKQLFAAVKDEIYKCDRVLTLHHLSSLMNDSDLAEDMFRHINKLLYNMFLNDDNFQSVDWNRRNASLQLFSAIIRRMINQHQNYVDEDNQWDTEISVLISFNFFIETVEIFLEMYSVLDKTVLVMFLELLSNYDADQFHNNLNLVVKSRKLFWELFDSPDYKIRCLAAKCFANFHHFYDDIPTLLPKIIPLLFNTLNDINFVHSLILSISFLIKKYIAHVRYVNKDFHKDEYLKEMRGIFVKCFDEVRKDEQALAFNYLVRCALYDLMIFIGFNSNDYILHDLMFKSLVTNCFGYDYFQFKMNNKPIIYVELK